jgi:tetratricopeptide (TPR) repeat protein
MGRADEGVRAFDRAEALAPDRPVGWYRRGLALADAGMTDEALEALSRAVELCRTGTSDAETQWVCTQAGEEMLWLGKVDGALAASEVALQMGPIDSYAWDLRGRVLGELGRRDESVEAHVKAVEANPSNPFAVANLGDALAAAHRADEAASAYMQAMALAPAEMTLRARYAMVLEDTGRYEEALIAARRALELDPEDGEAWYLLARTACRCNVYDEALVALRRCLACDPDLKQAIVEEGELDALRMFPEYYDLLE